MRESLLLLGRYVRESLRRPATRRLLVFALALLLVVLVGLGRGARGGSTVLGASLLAVGVVAFVAAAAAGALLPGDRTSGRAAWLATLAPSGAEHRVAAALAGGGLAALLALLGAMVVALVVPRLVDGVQVRRTRSIEVGRVQRLAPAERRTPPWRLPLPHEAAGSTVEVTFAPPYALADAPLALPRVSWRIDEATSGETELAYGRPLRVDLPAGLDRNGAVIEVWNRTPGTWLFVREARLLGPRTSFLLSLLVAGLLLGVAATALAPTAVLVSRFTSASTAILAGLVLALAGVLAPWLAGPATPAAGWSEAWGAWVLRSAARLAPDLSGLSQLGEPGAGHALTLTALASCRAPLVYAGVVLLLVALPLPRAWRREDAP